MQIVNEKLDVGKDAADIHASICAFFRFILFSFCVVAIYALNWSKNLLTMLFLIVCKAIKINTLFLILTNVTIN